MAAFQHNVMVPQRGFQEIVQAASCPQHKLSPAQFFLTQVLHKHSLVHIIAGQVPGHFEYRNVPFLHLPADSDTDT